MARRSLKIIFCSALGLLFSCQSENGQPEFQIEPDFELKQVAKEPLIQDPVDLEFDEHGDALVLEMPGYPLEDKPSRIKILKDEDKDGIYDQQILFAENLQMATSIMTYKKGVLVAAPPYLLFLRDDDQNYVVDAVDTLMGGFSTGNLQHNYNGLTYGLDNWIYVANGGNSGKPFWWNDSTSALKLRGQDLRFNLDRHLMELVGESSGGFGLAVDEYNRFFETHNLTHISHLVFPDRYLLGPKLSIENTLSNISDHEENGLARIYPIGEQESRVNHPEQSGYFSGSCGITYYGGGAFGPEYENTIWVADVVLNLIHVDKIKSSGASFSSSRIMDKKEFLASRDRSFRPVNMTVGPDGALFVVDMYRTVIEHPEWIPDEMEKDVDLNAGKDKGRIYKVTRKGISSSPFEFVNLKSTTGCIESLEHSNQWVRKTAHRLLMERKLDDQDLKLLGLMLSSKNNLARLHAMWILKSKGELTEDQLLKLLNDLDAGVRENALVVAEDFIDEHDAVVSACLNLINDENQRVRMQAALTINLLNDYSQDKYSDEIQKRLVEAASLSCDDWNVASITLAAKFDLAGLFNQVVSSGDVKEKLPLLKSLGLAASESVTESQKILASLSSKLSIDDQSEIILALSNGKPTNGGASMESVIRKLEKTEDIGLMSALSELRTKFKFNQSPELMRIARTSIQKSSDSSLPENVRLEHLSLLTVIPFSEKSEVLFQCIQSSQPLTIQDEALRQLSKHHEASIGKKLVDLWKHLGPQTRRRAGDLLLYNESHHDALLSGLENGVINIGEMNFDLERRRTLLWWTDNESTKRRAEKLFSDAGVITRQDAINKMKGALTLTGSAENGAQVFQNVCSNCHVFGKTGKDVGPVLTEISRKSKETLLHDILDPNAAVDTKYINHRLETQQGTVHVGIVQVENDKAITIMKIGGESVTISKSDIKEFNSLGTSLMMEGFEGSITQQEMADLLAYLQSMN